MPAFLGSQIKASDYVNTVWRVIDAPEATSLEDLLKPETWAHCAKQLRPYDEIVVIPHGAPYRAHLIVVDKGTAFAKVRVLNVTMLNAADHAELDESVPVEVKWNGPTDKYAVFRRVDGHKLQAGFAIKVEAEKWGVEHVKAMAR